VAGAARQLSGERIPRVSSALKPGSGPMPYPQVPSAPRGPVVYFPACPTRMFGAPDVVEIPGQGPLTLLPTADAMVELLKRVGFDPIVPRNLNGQCCGQPFESKGFPAEAARVGADLIESLDLESHEWLFPVLTDASTCAKHMRGHGETRVADSPEFLLAEVLPHLTITAPVPVVAVHHNCSAQRLGEQRATEALARAMAGRIAVLTSVTCCGYAGDKGLFLPELNEHATRFVKDDIPEECGVGVSTVSTCASGLSERAGVPFVSLASLLEAVSR
jgi:D-lactate dehydrogenase